MIYARACLRRALLVAAAVVPIWVSGIQSAEAQDTDLKLRTDVAGRREFRFELGVVGGGHFFHGEHTLGRSEEDPQDLSPATAGAFGLQFGVNVGRFMVFEAEGLATQTNTRDFATDMWVFQLGGHVRFHPGLRGRVQPYLLLGYGAIASVVDDKAVEDDDQDGVGRAGLGLKIGITDRLNLRLEGRVQSSMAFASEWLALGDETGYGGPDFLGLASVSLNLGATRPKLWVEDKVVVKDPEIPDDDRDGISNRGDRCPKVPEDPDHFEDEDGCPEQDNDGDGLADAQDRCPVRAETKNGVDDQDGCPEADEDGDRIVGTQDQCPNEVEAYNGFKDGDGCPDALPEDVRRFVGPVAGLSFRGRTTTLVASAMPLLDRVAEVLKQYPEMKIEIAGHVEGRPNNDASLALSRQRAEKVRDHLVSKGIPAERITTVGYGADRPIARASSTKNRRIELRVLTADATPNPGQPGQKPGEAAPAQPKS